MLDGGDTLGEVGGAMGDVVIEGCEGEGENVGAGTFVPVNGCDK